MPWRPLLAVVVAALVAAFGALVLGEYEFEGTLPFVAGALFGLVIGEVVVGIGRSRSWAVAVPAALLAAGGIAWAGWIDASQGVEPVKALVWPAAALAAVAALVRTLGLPGRTRRPPA
jgi:peptidoglycan/LPS O-acetylase OafA/YrhL